ncbi:MAG: Fur family transcriptional regulator [Kosmotogaceae bacterium]
MLRTNEAVRYLKNKGYRITPQRVAVLKALEGNTEHPSAEEIFRTVLKTHPNISIATIYNVLELLEKESLINAVARVNGMKRFDPNTKVHPHFICRRCHKVYDIPIDREKLVDCFKEIPPEGFITENVKITLEGICKNCNKK